MSSRDSSPSPSPSLSPPSSPLSPTTARGTSTSTVELAAIPLKILHFVYAWTVGTLFSQSANFTFSLFGLVGMVRWTRDIVRIIPTKPGTVRLDASRTGSVSGKKQSLRKVNEWVGENVPSLKERFTPAFWLPNGHLQTLYTAAGDFTKIDKVHYSRTYLRLPDGGTLGIDSTPENHHDLPPDAPTVIVCHGLTGGSHESYVRNVLAWVIRPKEKGGLGGRGVVVNFRGCAGVPITSPQLYSAGTTMDLALALTYLKTVHPLSLFLGVGFSLGASVLSRYLGEYGDRALVDGGIVLGCPWDLGAMSHKLENDWFTARVYSSTLAKNVLNLFFRAYDKDPSVFETETSRVRDHVGALKQMRKRMGTGSRLRDVDDLLTSQIGGPSGIGAWPFDGAGGYYDWASPKNVLGGVKVPLLAINAFDDPVVDCSALPLQELQNSTHVITAITGSGGHLGWFDGPLFGAPEKTKQRWVLKPVSEFLSAASRDFARPSEKEGNGEKTVEIEEGDGGWMWVKMSEKGKGGTRVIEGYERVGWRVLGEGEVVKGEGDDGEGGLVQGL